MTARHALLVKRCRKYAGLLLLLAAFSAAAETAGERRWIITMTWLPQAQFAGVYYAKEAGIFEKYGLSVEIRHKTAELSIIDYLTQKRSEFIVAPLATALLAGRRRFRWSTSARSARAAPSCWSRPEKTASGKRKT